MKFNSPIPLMTIIINRKRFSKKYFCIFVDSEGKEIMRSKGYKNMVSLIKGINFIKSQIGTANIIHDEEGFC